MVVFLHENQADARQPLLIKAPNRPEVYWVSGDQKYHIRSEQAFKSYGFSWAQVKTVSVQQVALYDNVRLIKTKDAPRVYRLDLAGGKKHWIPNEDAFFSYGFSFEEVFTVSDHDLAGFPDLRLVKTASRPEIYYLQSENRRHVPTERDFLALGFSWSDVAVISEREMSAYRLSENLTYENDGTIPNVQLQTSIAADSPRSFASLTKNNLAMRVEFASGSLPVKIYGVELTQIGSPLGSGSYVHASSWPSATPMSGSTNLSAQRVRLYFDPSIEVTPNSIKKINILVDLGVQTSESRNFALTINQVLSNAETSQIASATSVFHSIITDKRISTRVSVDVAESTKKKQTVTPGETNRPLAVFQVSVTNQKEDVLLEKIIFTQRGTLSLSKLTNIAFYSAGKKYTSAITVSGNQVIIDLSGKPLKIIKDKPMEISLNADITTGAGDSILFTIENENHVSLTGAESKLALSALPGTHKDFAFPIGDANDVPSQPIWILEPKVVILAVSNKSNTVLPLGQKKTKVGSFTVQSTQGKVALDQLALHIFTSGNAEYSGDVQVTVGSGKSASYLSLPADRVINRAENFILTKPIEIAQNAKITIDVFLDIPDSVASAETLQVKISSLHFRSVPSNNDFTSFSEVVADALSLRPISVNIVRDPDQKDREIVAGKTKQVVGRFLFENASSETVVLESVKLRAVSGAFDYSAGVRKLAVNGAKDSLYVQNQTAPYLVPANLSVSKNTSKIFEIIADTDANTESLSATLELTEARYSSQKSQKVFVTPLSVFLGEVKVLKTRLNIGADLTLENSQTIDTAGDVVIARFVFENTSAESVRISDLTLAETANSAGLSYSRGYENIRLIRMDTGKKIGASISRPVAGSAGNVISGFTLSAHERFSVNVIAHTTGSVADSDKLEIILRNIHAGSATYPNLQNLSGPYVSNTVTVRK